MQMTYFSFMFRRTMLAPAIAVAVMFYGVPISAQQQQESEPPFSFGVGFGAAATPGGGIGSLGLGTLELGTPWRNVDVRLDGAVTNWPGKNMGPRLTSLTGNLVYTHRIGVFAPYLLGGVGGYAQQGVGTSFGVNGGVGIKASVRRLQPFIELREHVWSADRTRRATLLTIGLMF
jgi:hypothetical protein